MLVASLQNLFEREIDKVIDELQSYKNEDQIWVIDGTVSNSAGNICLHLIGNLNTFIGAGLAKTDYVRDRPLEFSAKNIPRATLIANLQKAKSIVSLGLSKVQNEDLMRDFPLTIWKKPTGMTFTLIHLLSHLSYHLGQINYHRRLLD